LKIPNGQARDTGNIWYKRHKTKTIKTKQKTNKHRKLKWWGTRAFTNAFMILYINDITLRPKNDLSLWSTNNLTFDPKMAYPCDLQMTYPCDLHNDLSLWPANYLTFDPKMAYPCDIQMI
jgi:hypothetical protein